MDALLMDHSMSNGNLTMPTASTVPSVNLSVEALAESKIQEVFNDGTEIYVKPMTMSEHLCKLANKIDFLAENEERGDKPDEDEEKAEFEKTKKSFQPPQWPWEGIRNHLRQALTEINVLIDVMAIANKKGVKKEAQPLGPPPTAGEGGIQYMMFDYCQNSATNSKPHTQLCAKKKGLKDAADILLEGEQRLRKAKSDNSSEIDYHMHLLQLRKNWRIKKLGTKIVGDLSFKTAGSDFWHSGTFEVVKKTDDAATITIKSENQAIPTDKSPIDVEIGSDLQGHASINVSIESGKRNSPLNVSYLNQNNSFVYFGVNNQEWHKKLLQAQDIIFCKELFNRLAKEAVQMKTMSTLTPFVVVGNKISAAIFPGTNLVVRLQHKQPDDTDTPKSSSSVRSIFSLNYAAMVLLQKFHKRQLQMPAPVPTSAVLRMPEETRKAAVEPKPLEVLMLSQEKEGSITMILEQLVKISKHYELRQNVCDIINNCGMTLTDPYIQSHWSTMAGSRQTNVIATILCSGFDNMFKTIIKFIIGIDNVKAIMKDAVVHLSCNPVHITDFIMHTMCNHILHTLQELTKVLGWTILQFHEQSGVQTSSMGTCGALLVSSPNGEISVSIRICLTMQNTVEYDVQVQFPRSHSTRNHVTNQSLSCEQEAVTSEKWGWVGGAWHPVNWRELQGRHFIQKIETLLICLNDYKL